MEGEIHAFLSMSDETALERAAEVDKRIASGERISELAGIPGQLKIICALRDSLYSCIENAGEFYSSL